MSEGITIALITAIGSLLGGVIGQIISASATVTAATVKANPNQSPDSNRSLSWSSILGGAIIGAVLTLVVLALLGLLNLGNGNLPNPTETSIAPLPTPIIDKSAPAPIVASGTILFEEDFQDDKVQGIGFSANPQWKFVVDETGNKVYEIDNRNEAEYKGFSFGMDEWENYRVEYRARFLNSTGNKSEIGLQVRSSGYAYYVLVLGEDETYLAYDIADGKGWTRLITQFPHLERNTWYKIRVDVQGELVSVYVDDTLWINVEGSQIQRGWIMIIAGAGTHAQIDDIHVTALDK